MNALTFDDNPISIIEHGDLPWMPGPEIGRALGYEDPHSAIARVHQRHEGEFAPEMTCLVKMTMQGQRRTVRVFSPRGALLLAMHASTPRAVAFRAFVLDILEGKRPLPGKADRTSRLTEALLLARPRWGRHLRYADMGLTHAEISRLEGVSQASISHDADALRELGLLNRPKAAPRGGALKKARTADV